MTTDKAEVIAESGILGISGVVGSTKAGVVTVVEVVVGAEFEELEVMRTSSFSKYSSRSCWIVVYHAIPWRADATLLVRLAVTSGPRSAEFSVAHLWNWKR